MIGHGILDVAPYIPGGNIRGNEPARNKQPEPERSKRMGESWNNNISP